jgi:hypothetical protein
VWGRRALPRKTFALRNCWAGGTVVVISFPLRGPYERERERARGGEGEGNGFCIVVVPSSSTGRSGEDDAYGRWRRPKQPRRFERRRGGLVSFFFPGFSFFFSKKNSG